MNNNAFIFVRPDKELLTLIQRAKSETGLMLSDLLEAAEKQYVEDYKKGIITKEAFSRLLNDLRKEADISDDIEVNTSSMRFQIVDTEADEETNAIIRKLWGVSKIRSLHKLKVLFINYLWHDIAPESEQHTAAAVQPEAVKKDYEKMQLQLKAIQMLLEIEDTDRLSELIEFLED